MICNLCLKDKKLQSKSHIVPQFMYGQIKGNEGYFHKIRKDTFKEYSSGRSIREFWTGEYESDILCANCDKLILGSRYEDYAAKVYQLFDDKLTTFQDITIHDYKNENGVAGKLLQKIDYTRFKLFLLSMLWRASIAKRDLFQQVKLGNIHNEALRMMIYDGDPKELEDYPCFIGDIGLDNPVLKGTMLPPKKIKINGNISYVFMISGLIYRFTVSKCNKDDSALAGVIHPNNDMIIWQAPEEVRTNYFNEVRKYIVNNSQT